MTNTPTTAQMAAANPATSAKVSANAGTGKTRVLSNRVLRLLLSGINPSKILCLTYTKAAAAEMSARVTDELKDWVLSNDSDLANKLQALTGEIPEEQDLKAARRLYNVTLQSMPPPRIQTIHSFCQEVLKRFPLEAGIAPYFEVLDESTSRELIRESKLKLLSKHQVEEEIVQAIDFIAGNSSETKFNSIISEVVYSRNKLLELQESGYLESLQNGFDGLKDLKREQILEFDEEAKVLVQKLKSAMQGVDTKTEKDGLDKLERALNDNDAKAYIEIFLTKADTKRAKILTNKALQNFALDEECLTREQDRVFEFVESLKLRDMMEYTIYVYWLAKGFLDVYQDQKEIKGGLDYNDLVFYTKKLFKKSGAAPWVLYKLDGGIDHVLIDEAQDTSPEQWEIAEILVGEFFNGLGAQEQNRTMFIVGDEKQSIYSFQGADPASFGQVSGNIASQAVEAEKNWREIPLDKSFRSVDAVLSFTDKIFNKPNIKQSISFDEREIEHEVHRTGQGGKVEIWPLTESVSQEAPTAWELPVRVFKSKSAESILAEDIAQTIASWLKGGRKLRSTGQKINESDIMILLRKRGSFADLLIKKLKENKIAVSGSDRLRIAEHIAIQDLVALGNFLLLPQDDLNLACLLKSPLFGMTEDELFEIAYDRGGESIYNRLQNNNKYNDLYLRLKVLYDIVDFVSPYELYANILDVRGGRRKFISRLGYEVNDPINEFLELALEFERSQTASLQEFLYWFSSGETEIKRDMEQEQNQVRIMTVHAAKGLQAPIVFLPDTTSKVSGGSNSHQELYWMGEEFLCAKDADSMPQVLQDMKEAQKQKEYDEYLRLLYVAVTRAEDELYICGTGANNIAEDCWYNILHENVAELGTEQGDKIVYETEQINLKPSQAKEQGELKELKLPEYFKSSLAGEKKQIELEQKSYDAASSARGVKIHKFFEHVVDAGQARKVANDYLGEDAKQISELLENDEFKKIFSSEAKSEVPLIGYIDGKIVSRRVDKLLVEDGKVYVIDFKTAKNIPEKIPAVYADQMRVYNQLVRQIYPDKEIIMQILWTSKPKLVTVPLDS